MIDTANDNLSITKQCQLLSLSRSSLYYKPTGETFFNLELMELIDKQFLQTPYYGSRQMTRYLKRLGYNVGRKRMRRLMGLLGVRAVYQTPRTSIPHPKHKIYPYLLKGLDVNHPNQVWCSDITYIPIKRGFLYLVAIMDWYSRKVLAWRLSNTMTTDFCEDALREAISLYGAPEIFNTDQGSQFTSFQFTNILKEHHVKISMDGKGRWMDNIFIERLWRSLKYECVYLYHFEHGKEAKTRISQWINHYNLTRPHSTFDGRTPHEVYIITSTKSGWHNSQSNNRRNSQKRLAA